MRAFITGVTGFAGSHLAEHLAAAGEQVGGSARTPDSWPSDLAPQLKAAIPLLPWDLHEPPTRAFAEGLQEFTPDVIYHLAAISIPSHCGDTQPTPEAVAVNVDAVARLIDLAAGLAKRPRIVFVSSCYVYAPVEPDAAVVHESSPLAPASAYGVTKLRAEKLLQAAVQAGLVEAVIARTFQHTGPRQSPRMIVPQWARQMAESSDEPIRVGSMDAWLDLSDVRDVVRGYRLLAEHGAAGEVYNVGGGVARRSGEIFEQLEQVAGVRRGFVETSPGRKQNPIADIQRVQAQTGWRPQIPFVKTLADCWDYWRRQP